MAWKGHGALEERFRFVQDWESEDWSMAELCRFYGVTRTTGYKWIDRYDRGGLEALRDQSRAPQRHPNEVSAELEELVITLREKHPSWGAPKIHARLKREHADQRIPAETTIGAILRRHGLTVNRRRRPRIAAVNKSASTRFAGSTTRDVRIKRWGSRCRKATINLLCGPMRAVCGKSNIRPIGKCGG
jgi:transposase